MNPLTQTVATERATLAQTLRLAHPRRRRDAMVLRGQLAQITATTRRIAALKPPGSARMRFLGYTRANAALVGALTSYIDAFASGTTAQQTAAAQGAQTAASRADGAETTLRDALK